MKHTLAGEAMNDDARPQQQRRRSRRRADNAPRRQGGGSQRGFTPRRRNDYASGQYSSIFTGPFPTDADEDGLNLADLQAKSVDELRELAAEHDIEGYEELEHSDLVLKLLDVVPLAPDASRRIATASPVPPRGSSRSSTRASASCA